MTITIDVETQSEADLIKVGAWAYSQHPSTDMICVCWKEDDRDMGEWWPGRNKDDRMPADLAEGLVHRQQLVEGHNISFEKSCWFNILQTRYGWWLPRPERWRDTMAVAAYMGMPLGLDKLVKALGYTGKDPEGSRLITKYSKLHLKTAQREIPDVDFFKFVDYCKDDVLLECSISDYLGDLPEDELEYFLLDQKINERGIYLDLHGIECASFIVDTRSADLRKEFNDLTGFNPTQDKVFKSWLKGNGFTFENLQKAHIQEELDNDFPQGPSRSALELRLKINKASTKKLDAMARNVGTDGRARFQTRYHGAFTGRNTGAGFQPLNLSRGFDGDEVPPEQLVHNIRKRDAKWLDVLYGDAMDAVAKSTRHWIRSEAGCTIYAGDFVSVEAVLLSCLAGEEWKIEAFRNKVKIYELMADKIYNLPPGTVNKIDFPVERQDGKTGELAFGYQGALGAWLKFDSSGRHTDERILEICRAWRKEHPNIVEFWGALERAAKRAIKYKGTICSAGPFISFQYVDDWLSMIAPDGKRIWYYKAYTRKNVRPHWHKPRENEDCLVGECDCGYTSKIMYMSYKEGHWKWVSTYGGKFSENATQMTSRQVLKPAVTRAENGGYPVILTVYDEVVSEVPDGFGSQEEFEELLLPQPGDIAYEYGWPISVDAWTGKVYKK